LSIVYFRFAAAKAAAVPAEVPAEVPVAPERAPLLERLLARADARTRVTDWRSRAYRVVAAGAGVMPGVAPLAIGAEFGAVVAACAYVATPVHYVATMSSVRLAEGGILKFNHAEAAELAGEFNRDFVGAGLQLLAGASGSLFAVFDQAQNADARDPEDAAGREIWDYLPTGPDSPALRRRMSEIEMWLFEHAINRARVARGALPVNGLWLWGGGPVLERPPAIGGWTAGNDPLFGAFPRAAEFAAGRGSGVVVIDAVPGTPAWRDVESRWLLPAAAALRAGSLSGLELSAAQYGFSVSARWSRRFWRRTRPWWELLV
jgi:hypothetical protein